MSKTIPVNLCSEQLDLIICHLSHDYVHFKDDAEGGSGSTLYHDIAWVLTDLIKSKKHPNYQENVNSGTADVWFDNNIEELLKTHNFNPEEN